MTAPRADYGADDQWAGDPHAWNHERDQRRATPLYPPDALCLCSHRRGKHVATVRGKPPRCMAAACGCIRYRDADATARAERHDMWRDKWADAAHDYDPGQEDGDG